MSDMFDNGMAGYLHTSPCTYGPMCPYCEIERLRAEVEVLRALLREAQEREQRFVMPLYRDSNYLARIDAAQAKAEQREQSLAVKARDYLHNWLACSIQEQLASHGAHWHELGNALVVWAALGKPGITSDWQRRGQRPSWEGLSHAIGEHPAARSAGITSIADVLARHLDESIDRAAYEASLEIVTSLTWGETLAVAKTIWTDLEAAWQLTNDTFLRLHRKAELAHLARTHGVPLPDGARSWDSMKTDQLVAELLKHPELLRRPAILVDLWNQEPMVSPDDPELLGDQDGGVEEFEEEAA